MIKSIYIFTVIWIGIASLIQGWRYSTNQEKWEIFKVLGFSFVVSIISGIILTTFVILF